MSKEAATVEQLPLTKRGLLEYLGAQQDPVTARVASIDLDSRASTVTEMLERCVAQGLAERTTEQRPREYRISQEGRRRLDCLRAKETGLSPESGEPGEPVREARQALSPRIQEISLSLTRLVEDVVEAAFQKRSKQANLSDDSETPGDEHAAPGPSRVKTLLERAERLADPEETEPIAAQPQAQKAQADSEGQEAEKSPETKRDDWW